jgi:hypothetical protein
MVINDCDFLEAFNNNFDETDKFLKLTHELSRLLIKGMNMIANKIDFIYEIVNETTNLKLVSFGHALCLYCLHLVFFTNNFEIKSLLTNLMRVNRFFVNENCPISFGSLKEATLKSMGILVFP